MTEPQSWVLIGVFTTIMLGGMTLMTTFITRALSASVGGLDSKIDALRTEMNARFEAVHTEMNARFEAMHTEMNARFEAVHVKIDHLDRDVSVITRRMWGEPSGE